MTPSLPSRALRFASLSLLVALAQTGHCQGHSRVVEPAAAVAGETLSGANPQRAASEVLTLPPAQPVEVDPAATAIGRAESPRVFETGWFRGLLVLAAIVGSALLYVMRVRHLTARAAERMHARLMERERIAVELHDTLLQGIHALLLRMQAVLDDLPDESARRRLEDAVERADEVVAQARDRIAGLRDTMHLPESLDAAIRALVADLCAGHDVRADVTIGGAVQPLHLDVRDEVLCIVREAVVNALRHAGANYIGVSLEFKARGLRLAIADDGKGIEPHVLQAGSADGHWGLVGMRDRADRVRGELRISSASESGGTKVELTIGGRAAFRQYDRRSKWRWRIQRET